VWPESARRAMGPGSMSMNQGKRHRTLRRLFEPAFKQGAVMDMVPTTVEITQEQLRKWVQKGRINGYKATLGIPFLVSTVSR
jgi:cytochrome P450